MAPSLRRLLRKASLEEVKKEEADLAPLQRSNSDDILTHAHGAEVNTNPVPQLDSSKRRPTPELVDSLRLDLRKRKGKLPISKFALPPPQRPLSSRRTKRDPISDRELFELSTEETGRDPVPKLKRVQVDGQDFDMIVTDSDTGNISAPVEDGDSPREMESSNRRITRYGGRRPTVAESRHEDIDNFSTRDFAPKPQSEGLQVPPLNINKKATSNSGDKTPTRIPSPRSSPRSPDDAPPIPPPKDTDTSRNISPDPITTDPAYTHQSAAVDSGTTPSPSPAPSSTGSNSSTSTSFSARTVKKFGFHTKQRAEARSSSSSSETRTPSLNDVKPFIPKDVPVVVRPPTYNTNLHAGLQWCEAGKTSSRASAPWEWNPRWTCCKCQATTIVEQKVCANLSCLHDRCPRACEVMGRPKHKGLFM
ncbi:hypothetical protein BST61_g8345 [Cercospora zeina]